MRSWARGIGPTRAATSTGYTHDRYKQVQVLVQILSSADFRYHLLHVFVVPRYHKWPAKIWFNKY